LSLCKIQVLIAYFIGIDLNLLYGRDNLCLRWSKIS